MRIGVFGGTFDPVHVGHLILAEQCREQGELGEVWFVPSARPPHKLDAVVTPFDRRADMLTLAITGQPQFRVDRLERDRPGPSFTADTLDELRQRHPEHTFALIVGADVLPDLKTWRDPKRILAAAELLAAARPGFGMMSAEDVAADLSIPTEAVRLRRVEMPQLEVSSRDIRRRVAEGRTIRYLTPRAVEEYVRERKLYGEPR